MQCLLLPSLFCIRHKCSRLKGYYTIPLDREHLLGMSASGGGKSEGETEVVRRVFN